MDAKFWHERWQTGQLGFHQSEVNPLLAQYWTRIDVPRDAPVFVPLCGKSLDMAWLREQGHPVMGIELSPIALEDFFQAASIAYTRDPKGEDELERFTAPGFELFCGDFFALQTRHLSTVRGVYDRAALIALPPEMRSRYAAAMIEKLPRTAKILLTTIEYDQQKMSGPPHSVPPSEVEALFGGHFEIESLIEASPVAPPPPFRERGLDVWQEHLFLLTRPAAKEQTA